MLDKLLSSLGFTDKEHLIISALLSAGKASAQTLARKTSLPRTTIYGLIDKLVKEGIVACDFSERSVSYAITDARVFSRMLEREQEALLKKKETVTQLETLLDSELQAHKFKGPRVVSAEGQKEVEKLLFEYRPKWRESYLRINHFTMWGYQDNQFVESYRRWHGHAWSVRDPREEIKLFSNPDGVAQQRKDRIERREIRLLPAGIQFSSAVWVHGEFLLLGVTTDEPHRVTIIHDATLTANLRSLFQWLWKMTTPKAVKE